MTKTLWLCEKPSQGRDMSKGIADTFTQRDGYMEGEKNIITWAFGHLASLCDVKDYVDNFKWSFENIPFIPPTFKYKIGDDKKKQFNTIKELIHRKDVDRIVEAGDPGREGELISRLILKLAENSKPVFRFWVSGALTPAVIQKGIAELKPAKDYDSLYESAIARQQSDWIVGINATIAYTVQHDELYTIGRVQTPVLSILSARELEVKEFKPTNYYTVSAEFAHDSGNYTGDNETHFNISEEAGKVVATVHNNHGVIKSATVIHKNEKPPLLFSLTELQKEANKLFDFTADESLQLAQSLYEKHKMLTYPRTESQHLGSEMPNEVKQILEHINIFSASITVNPSDKRIFDDSKLTDHHAIIPTGEESGGLSHNEQAIYDLVARRFMAAFMADYEFDTTTIITTVADCDFKTTGKVVVAEGWRSIYHFIDTKDKPLSVKLYSNDPVKVAKCSFKVDKTKAPSRYTEATLLDAMQHAAKFVTDGLLKKILKETAGIGTPATRAATIEMLKDREYVKSDKKSLAPTEKGLALYNLVKGERIADPAFTAYLEQQLEEISQGADPAELRENIVSFTEQLIASAKSSQVVGKKSVGKCPECGGAVTESPKSFKCSCGNFTLWKNGLEKLGHREITVTEATVLLMGKTIPLKKLKGKSGKSFDADGKLIKDPQYGYKVELVFKRR